MVVFRFSSCTKIFVRVVFKFPSCTMILVRLSKLLVLYVINEFLMSYSYVNQQGLEGFS